MLKWRADKIYNIWNTWLYLQWTVNKRLHHSIIPYRCIHPKGYIEGRVPIPSMKIQAKIVEAMNSIDNEYNHNPLTLDKELEAKRAVLSKYLQ